MRPYTPKRAAINAAAADFRKDLVEAVSRCEWCGGNCGTLDLHEISQGARLQSLEEPACVLVLGRPCHDLLHRMPERRQVGLALLRLSRPDDYSLARFWDVTKRRWPEQREVDVWITRLTRNLEFVK